MNPFDDMPEDAAELAKRHVELPYLDPNTEESCPATMEEVLDYLSLESSDGEDVSPEQLRFLRTAQVTEQRYWIWAFKESDGSDCYVTVAESPNGDCCIAFDENADRLTPEQYMLRDCRRNS